MALELLCWIWLAHKTICYDIVGYYYLFSLFSHWQNLSILCILPHTFSHQCEKNASWFVYNAYIFPMTSCKYRKRLLSFILKFCHFQFVTWVEVSRSIPERYGDRKGWVGTLTSCWQFYLILYCIFLTIIKDKKMIWTCQGLFSNCLTI